MRSLNHFLKQTPNLKHLTISSSNNVDMIDAHQWERLITFALPYLKIVSSSC
jgi:hypothetical protein